MKLLQLSGKYAIDEYKHTILDDEDYLKILEINRKWNAHPDRKNKKFKLNSDGKMIIYPTASINHKKIQLHRFIMNVTDPKIKVDHINHNTLDNRKENLRLATNQQNSYNSKSRKNSSSKYLGVCYSNKYNKWRANIRISDKQVSLGYFLDEGDAALAYDKKAKESRGEFAYLNFPNGCPVTDTGE